MVEAVPVRYPFGDVEIVENVPRAVVDEYLVAKKRAGSSDAIHFPYQYEDSYPQLAAYCFYQIGRIEKAYKLNPHIFLAASLAVRDISRLEKLWQPHRDHVLSSSSSSSSSKSRQRPHLFRLCDAVYDCLTTETATTPIMFKEQIGPGNRHNLLDWLHSRTWPPELLWIFNQERLNLVLKGASSRTNHVNNIGHFVRNGFCLAPNFEAHEPRTEWNSYHVYERRDSAMVPLKHPWSPEQTPLIYINADATPTTDIWFSFWENDFVHEYPAVCRRNKGISDEVAQRVTCLTNLYYTEQMQPLKFMPCLQKVYVNLANLPDADEKFMMLLSEACPNLLYLDMIRQCDIEKEVKVFPLPVFGNLQSYKFSGHVTFLSIVAPKLESLYLSSYGELELQQLALFKNVKHARFDHILRKEDIKYITQHYLHLETFYCVRIHGGKTVRGNGRPPPRRAFKSPNMYKLKIGNKEIFDKTGNVVDAFCVGLAYAFRYANARHPFASCFKSLLPDFIWATFGRPASFSRTTTTTTASNKTSRTKRKRR